MKRRTRLLVSGTVTVFAMTMVLIGTLESSVPFVGPADLGPTLEGKRLQVEGIVQGLTVGPDDLTFELSDGAGATVLVRYPYSGQRPLTLEEGRLVVAKGLYRQRVVEAYQVSVRAHEDPGSP